MRVIALLTAFSALLVPVHAADAYCSKPPYNALNKLSAVPAAKTYCSQKYPISPRTTTETTTTTSKSTSTAPASTTTVTGSTITVYSTIYLYVYSALLHRTTRTRVLPAGGDPQNRIFRMPGAAQYPAPSGSPFL